jgi:sarcosine oxidase gamma subunit
MAGGKLPSYIDQAADAEALAAARLKANQYPAVDVSIRRTAVRVADLEARVAELERKLG